MVQKYKISFLLLLSFVCIYYLGSFSKIPFGDSMGFVVQVEKGHLISSTSTYSHFLFTNTLVILKNIFPFIESKEISRFVVVFSGAFCLVILHKIVLMMTRSKVYSIFCAVLFGLSFSFWKNAEIVEVYTFNLVFVGLFIYYAAKFLLAKDRKYLFYTSLFLGLSLWIHIQNILLIPALFLLFYFSKNYRDSIISFAIFGILLIGLVLVPVINNESVSAVFSSGVLMQNIQFSSLLFNLMKSIGYLFYNFWYFLILLPFGCLFLFKNQFRIFLFLMLVSLPIFSFATIFGVSDNYVFFIPFNFVIALLISLGAFYLKEKRWIKKVCYTVILIPLFYVISYKIISTTEKGKQLHEEKSYKGGLSYFLLPWMNDNVGIVEFTYDKKIAPEKIDWMTKSADEYIEIFKSKNCSEKEIKTH